MATVAAPPAGVTPPAAPVPPAVFTPIQEKLRRYIFYGVFVFLAVLYFGIVTTFDVNQGPISGFFMKYIVVTAPFVLQEIPLIGELVPAVLGGVIAATAPARASNTQLLIVLAMAAVVYFFYLHMSVFLSTQGDPPMPFTPGLREELEAQGLPNSEEAVKVLSSFASSVRNFAAFVFAALIGIKFNDARLAEIPMLRGRRVADAAAGAAAAPSANEAVEAPPPGDESDGSDAGQSPAGGNAAPNG